jgi:hypothetical protein
MELILAKIQMLKVEKDSATNFDTNTIAGNGVGRGVGQASQIGQAQRKA